jgi:peptidoglycan hydrolase-like protein with peptidoglycan-binding domain
MQRTYHVPAGWAGLVAIVATLVLLALPGTSIAGGTSQSARSSSEPTAGLLQLGAGYAGGGEAPQVRALQRRLRSLGWRPGPTDGLFGPRTEAAVARFQKAAGLAADGVVGPATRDALAGASAGRLTQGAGYAQPNGSPRVKKLQRQLRRAGLRPGPIDGRFGPRTEAAVTRFQQRRGLPATAVVDPRTRRALAATRDRQAARRAVDRGQIPRPAAIVLTGTGPSDDPIAWLVLTGLMALAFGAVAGLFLGRLRSASAAPAIALARGVVAEGKTRVASVGRFRGHVHALVLGRRGLRGTQEARYLISDPEKAAPFWVDQQEIDRLDRDEAEEPEPEPEPPPDQPKVLGYVSVEGNGDPEGGEIRQQAESIDSLCRQRGWRLLELVRDVDAAGGLERPGLMYAVERLAKGEAACLVVSELTRLGNSAADLGRVLDSLARTGGRLVAMDVGLDTASDAGRIAANSLLRVCSLESPPRPLAAAGARRTATGEDVPALKERILQMRAEGLTLQGIADQLNDEGVPTMRGGRLWRPSSVQAALGYRRPRRRRNEEAEHM